MQEKFVLARDAIDFLELHAIEPTEVNFSFGMAVCDGVHPDLNRAIAEEIDGGLRLTADKVSYLIDRYLGAPASAALASRERAVVQQSTQLGELTHDAHDLTVTLRNDVSTMASEAGQWPQSDGIVQRLDRAETELAGLRRDFLTLYEEIKQIHARDSEDRAARHEEERVQLAQIIDVEKAKGRTFVLILFRVDDMEEIRRAHGDAVVGNVLKAFRANIATAFDDQCTIVPLDQEFAVIVGNKAASVARDEAESAVSAFAMRRFKLRGTGEWIGRVTASAGLAVSTHDDGDILIAAQERLSAAAMDGGDRVGY